MTENILSAVLDGLHAKTMEHIAAKAWSPRRWPSDAFNDLLKERVEPVRRGQKKDEDDNEETDRESEGRVRRRRMAPVATGHSPEFSARVPEHGKEFSRKRGIAL